jgi:hypothetical protein
MNGPSLTALGGAKVILELDKPQGGEKTGASVINCY